MTVRVEHLTSYLYKAGWDLCSMSGHSSYTGRDYRPWHGFIIKVREQDTRKREITFKLRMRDTTDANEVLNAYEIERHLSINKPNTQRAAAYYRWLHRPWYRKVYDYLLKRKAY